MRLRCSTYWPTQDLETLLQLRLFSEWACLFGEIMHSFVSHPIKCQSGEDFVGDSSVCVSNTILQKKKTATSSPKIPQDSGTSPKIPQHHHRRGVSIHIFLVPSQKPVDRCAANQILRAGAVFFRDQQLSGITNLMEQKRRSSSRLLITSSWKPFLPFQKVRWLFRPIEPIGSSSFRLASVTMQNKFRLKHDLGGAKRPHQQKSGSGSGHSNTFFYHPQKQGWNSIFRKNKNQPLMIRKSKNVFYFFDCTEYQVWFSWLSMFD